MNLAEWASVIVAAGGVFGGGGWWVSRATLKAARVTAEAQRATAAATEAAARATAAPAQQAADLAVMQATITRVDEENGQLRGRVFRVEALLRAFVETGDRWTRQMRRAGIEPEPAHPLVDEYNRTGV